MAKTQRHGGGLRLGDHLGRHVDAGHATAGADLAGGDERVESGAGPDVENVLAGLQPAQCERVADAREGFDGTIGKRVNDGAGIAQPFGQGPSGAEAAGVTRPERDLAVLAAYLASHPVGIHVFGVHCGLRFVGQ